MGSEIWTSARIFVRASFGRDAKNRIVIPTRVLVWEKQSIVRVFCIIFLEHDFNDWQIAGNILHLSLHFYRIILHNQGSRISSVRFVRIVIISSASCDRMYNHRSRGIFFRKKSSIAYPWTSDGRRGFDDLNARYNAILPGARVGRRRRSAQGFSAYTRTHYEQGLLTFFSSTQRSQIK